MRRTAIAPILRLLALAFLLADLAGCAATRPPVGRLDAREGVASYYARHFDGRRTASGERYDAGAMTAAHPSLPFGTCVRVTNLENGRQVVLRINDRGPSRKGRILDVSHRAARALGMIRNGTARVRLDVL